MKQKALSLLLCAVLAGTLLAGCGNGAAPAPESSPSGGTTAPSSGGTDAPPEDGGKGETYTYHIFQELAAETAADAPIVKHWEEEFNVKFEFEYIEKDKRAEIVPLRIASGDVADVICTMGYANFRQWAQDGILGTWDPQLLRDSAPNIAAAIDELGDFAWKMASIDGQQFTLPGVNGNYAYGNAMIYRKSWLDKVNGGEIPRTLEEFEKVVYAFANDDPDGNGKKDTYGLSNTGVAFINSNFGVFDDVWIEDGAGGVQWSFLAPQKKEALALLAKWYQDGVLDPEFVTGENTGGYWAVSHAFDNGRIGFTAMGVASHWKTPELIEKGDSPTDNYTLFHENFPDDSYIWGYPIEIPGGKKCTGITDYAYWSGFSADLCKDTDRLARFFQIIETTNGFKDPKDALYSQYGEEGVQYKVDEATGAPLLQPPYDQAEELTRIGGSTTFIFMNNYKTDILFSPLYANWRDNELYGDPDRSAMWPNAVPVQPASAQDYLEEIKKITSEGCIKIITGEQPIDYYETLVEKVKATGYDQLLKEATEIYQEYN